MDIDSLTDYALQIPERPRTLESVETHIQRRKSKLLVRDEDLFEIDKIGRNSVSIGVEMSVANVEEDVRTSLVSPFVVSKLPIVTKKHKNVDYGDKEQNDVIEAVNDEKPKLNFPDLNKTLNNEYGTPIREIMGEGQTSEGEPTIRSRKKKGHDLSDELQDVVSKYKNTKNRRQFIKEVVGLVKNQKKNTSGQPKPKKADNDSREKEEEFKEKFIKSQEGFANTDTQIISRLLISLSHEHPSEIKKKFGEIDKKLRSTRPIIDNATFIKILQKPGLARAPAELQMVDDFLRTLVVFASKPDYVIARLAVRLKIETYSLGMSIFRQGDPGIKWYVIFTGSVKITVTKPGFSYLDSNAPQNYIATLKEGEKFGDHALLNDQNRNASAWADSKSTILLTLDKPDFMSLIGQQYQIEQKNRINFLKKVKMLENLDIQSLRNIADRLVLRTLPKNSMLIREGEYTDTVFFIKSGTCGVTKEIKVTTKSGEVKNEKVFLGRIHPNSSFNEDCVFSNRNTFKGSPFTVFALENVEIATIANSGEWLNFNLKKTKTIYETCGPEELEFRYKISLQTKKFRDYQKKYIQAVLNDK